MDLPVATGLLGGMAALASAASWAVGSILFRNIGEKAPPLGMNLGKGLIGLVYLGVALAFVGLTPTSPASLGLLAVSGLVGIAAGDTLFFMALVRLEPRLTLLLATLGQAFTVLLALAFLGERPAPLAWVGMVLIVAGVTWVMREQQGDDEPEVKQRRFQGIVYGLLCSLCMSAGFLLAKTALDEVPALQATFLRLAAGVAGLLILGGVQGHLGTWLAPFREPALLRSILVAVAVIMFGGFYLSLLALQLTDAAIASVLLSTEPIFILPLALFFTRERVSLRSVLGAVVAVVGVAVVLVSLG